MEHPFFVVLITGLLALSSVQYGDCAADIPEFTTVSEDRDTEFVPSTSWHLLPYKTNDANEDDEEDFKLSDEAIGDKQDDIANQVNSLNHNFESIQNWFDDAISNMNLGMMS